MDIDTSKQHVILNQDSGQGAKAAKLPVGIRFTTLCTVIAGACGWTDIGEYELSHRDGFCQHQLFEQGLLFSDIRTVR
ncbi:hypothetical protein [Aeromonas sp. MdU4]|uniref:hypothetical protein n=1 Tax=Aeromonas sp. MdU4 TaxID=3342819 RepID=UPI0035B74BA0